LNFAGNYASLALYQIFIKMSREHSSYAKHSLKYKRLFLPVKQETSSPGIYKKYQLNMLLCTPTLFQYRTDEKLNRTKKINNEANCNFVIY
jgi:hypothetical protein